MYLYSYLIADLGMLLIWLVLFLLRKDIRKAMFTISIIFGIGGLVSQYVYINDWWKPLTITNTTVGIEDFLFGFWIAGIATVIYEELFKKMVYPRKQNNKKIPNIIFLSFLLATLFYFNYYILKFSSFYSSIFAFTPLILFIWYKRKDLIPDSLITGLLISLLGFLWFWIPEFFTPGWVKHYWLLKNLSGIIILKAPIEDLIWGFVVGAYIGPLYEFWQGARFVKYRKLKTSRKRK